MMEDVCHLIVFVLCYLCSPDRLLSLTKEDWGSDLDQGLFILKKFWDV